MGLKAPNLCRKHAENERSYFLGFGGFCLGSFLGVCFALVIFVMVVCGFSFGRFSVVVSVHLFAFKVSFGFM